MQKIHFNKIYLFIFLSFKTSIINSFTIVLDPAGDSRYAGRIIGESFERGITAQFTKELKKELDLFSIKTIITRYPGETLEPLQNAYIGNKTDADLYISINFYHELDLDKANYLSVYYSLYNTDTDLWDLNNNYTLTFLPYNDAYKKNITSSKKLASIFFENITLKKMIFLGIPFKPLIGVAVPAFGIEIGLNRADEWKNCVTPVVKSIIYAIKQIENL